MFPVQDSKDVTRINRQFQYEGHARMSYFGYTFYEFYQWKTFTCLKSHDSVQFVWLTNLWYLPSIYWTILLMLWKQTD